MTEEIKIREERKKHRRRMTEFEDQMESAVDVDDALALAASMKSTGNDLFKAGDVSGARSSYDGALDALKALTEDIQKEEKVKTVLIALHGNCAMCSVKSEEWSAAVEAASEVIQRQSDNVKALYRRGLSYHKLKNHDKAKKDLVACLKADPTNASAKKGSGVFFAKKGFGSFFAENEFRCKYFVRARRMK